MIDLRRDRGREYRQLDAGFPLLQMNQLALFQLKLASRTDAHQRRIIPSQLGDRLRQLLKPSLFASRTVIHGVTGVNDNFELERIDRIDIEIDRG